MPPIGNDPISRALQAHANPSQLQRHLLLVGDVGIEPTRLSARASKTRMATNYINHPLIIIAPRTGLEPVRPFGRRINYYTLVRMCKVSVRCSTIMLILEQL